MVSLIDADSIVYIIAWNHKEGSSDTEVCASVDSVVTMILHTTLATEYIGVLSGDHNFRHDVYKYDVYKGQRPPKPEWHQQFEKVIKDRLISRWKFYVADQIEADDAICAHAEECEKRGHSYTICSPDKDLRQIHGKHFDYKKNELIDVTPDKAFYNLCIQLLSGDRTDNITGIPGLGEVKSKLILDKAETSFSYLTDVKAQYIKAFGPYYGPEIYDQTLKCVRLLNSKHPLIEQYKGKLLEDFQNSMQDFDASQSTYEDIRLSILGW
jgi:5'-3' exonuclease